MGRHFKSHHTRGPISLFRKDPPSDFIFLIICPDHPFLPPQAEIPIRQEGYNKGVRSEVKNVARPSLCLAVVGFIVCTSAYSTPGGLLSSLSLTDIFL
ncbi:hypothetical protein TNIN_118741 [Trichonephila inaurata madagascariensis]|uniref:Uncharacterized protein n=1 Tax=Trichonephila inaurata madagascariensis TaxID=2747483 RepID=A0A8X6I954_9ARAC|nr:hypothetical protein TNIN_118741 [Trichonephila inaurata madagascariensis]